MVIFLLLSILVSPLVSHEHNCSQHEIIKKRGKLDKNDPRAYFPKIEFPLSEDRLLADDSWHTINILFDTSMITGASDKQKTFIINAALPLVKANFESFLSVKGPGTIPPFTSTLCEDDLTIPSSYQNNSTNADLIIFVKTYSENSSTLAAAQYCKYESTYTRPVIGLMVINLNKIRISAESLQSFVLMLMHETLHVLVYYPDHYDNFYGTKNVYVTEQKTSTTGTKTVYKFITSKMLTAARTQFNCQSLSGVYLEDDGGSGSAGAHLEKRQYGKELMTSTLTGFEVLSDVTLALMEDSGWYQVDHTKAQFLAFGYKEGCSFLGDACPSTADFCSASGTKNCNKDYTAKTTCGSDTFINGCYVNDYWPGDLCTNLYDFNRNWKGEEPGPSSRCFVSNVNNTQEGLCFKSSCENGKILILIDGETVTCETSGQSISHSGITITCPDISMFCDYLSDMCPNDCSGYGVCLVGGGCRCDYLYIGTNCSTFKDCDADDALICSDLKSSNSMTETLLIALLLVLIVH